jgi:uncharacterized protein
MAEPAELPAGEFSAWLAAFVAAQRGEGDADVPCDGCTACCTAAKFVPIGPDEADTLAHVSAELLVPAPGMPDGHVVLGYDEAGRCPMLVEAGCSIYEHRPRACRTFDCRVFAAAGVDVDGAAAEQLRHRVRRWRFSHPTAADRHRHDAVEAAARAIAGDERLAAEGLRPTRSDDVAVLAVAVHHAFLEGVGDTVTDVADPGSGAVRVAVRSAHRART